MMTEVCWAAERLLEWARQTSSKNDADLIYFALKEMLMPQHSLGNERLQRTIKGWSILKNWL